MPSGGHRTGAGRPRGAKDSKPRKTKKPAMTDQEKIRKMLSMGMTAKARFYQEFLVRISNGEKLNISEKRLMDKLGAELTKEVKPDAPPTGETEQLDSTAFLVKAMNDQNVDMALRIRAAEILRKDDGEKKGKKEQREERAKAAGSGRFRTGEPPQLKVVKTEK